MKKYTITEKEYAEMVEAMNALAGENQKLRGFIDGMKEQLIIGGVVKSLPTEIDEFLNYIKETCITDCNEWHSLLHNKQFKSNNNLYKQYLKDKK